MSEKKNLLEGKVRYKENGSDDINTDSGFIVSFDDSGDDDEACEGEVVDELGAVR